MGTLVDALHVFREEFILPPPIPNKEERDTVWVGEQLLQANLVQGNVKRLVLDNKYLVCEKKVFQDWVQWDWSDEKTYLVDKYDCENFAFSFKARTDRKFGLNNVGLVIDYSGGHAYNVVMFSDSPPELYEPQSDSWIKKGQGKPYRLARGYILI